MHKYEIAQLQLIQQAMFQSDSYRKLNCQEFFRVTYYYIKENDMDVIAVN